MAHPFLGRRVQTTEEKVRLIEEAIGPSSIEIEVNCLVDGDGVVCAILTIPGFWSGLTVPCTAIHADLRNVAPHLECLGLRPPFCLLSGHNHTDGITAPSDQDRQVFGVMTQDEAVPLDDMIIVATPNPKRPDQGLQKAFSFGEEVAKIRASVGY